jgi:hypothetical protein
MTTEVLDFVNAVRVGAPVRADGVTFYPLTRDGAPAEARVLLLDDAIAQGLVEVCETGVVAELEVVNKGDQRILILEGDIVQGGRQNRVMNTSCVIPSKATVKVPTSCVERGRWAGTKNTFKTSGLTVSPLVKSALKRSVHDSTISTKGLSRRSDQSSVWDQTSATITMSGTFHAPNDDHLAAYQAKAGELEGKVAKIVDDLVKAGSVVGIAVTRGDGHASVEAFDSTSIARKVLPRVVKAHLLVPSPREADRAPSALLDDVRSAETTRVPGVAGLGEELRLQRDQMTGLAFVLDAVAVHLSADWDSALI